MQYFTMIFSYKNSLWNLLNQLNICHADGNEVEKYLPSQLGAAVLASALSPDEGLIVFAELQKARRNFVLENELHIIYQV